MAVGDASGPVAGELYAEYVEKLLDAELKRKEVLQQRGLGVVATSASLATLFLGFLTALVQVTRTNIPVQAHWELAVAVVLFAAAGASGISANTAVTHRHLSLNDLQTGTGQGWNDTADSAAAWIAADTLERLRSTDRHNRQRAWCVTIALGLEILAVIALAGAVAEILHAGPTAR